MDVKDERESMELALEWISKERNRADDFSSTRSSLANKLDKEQC